MSFKHGLVHKNVLLDLARFDVEAGHGTMDLHYALPNHCGGGHLLDFEARRHQKLPIDRRRMELFTMEV